MRSTTANIRGHDAHLATTWVIYLHGFATWTHAATFTLKRKDQKGFPCTERILIDTTKHFIKAVNYACLKKKSQRGHSIASAVTYGWGAYGDQPHIHCSFEAPAFMGFDEFAKVLNACADKTYWFDRERKIKPYFDYGWSKYLLEHGTDNFIDEVLIPSHPTE